VITAIIGVGNLGSALARQLVAVEEDLLVVAAQDEAHAAELAHELGPRAEPALVEDAIASADVVILALWLDQIKELIREQAHLLEHKVVVDPSNPLGFDESGQVFRTLGDGESARAIVASLLPASARYVKAFGTLGADSLATSANREPHRVVLFYATDDEVAAGTVEQLIRAAGFEPVRAGGFADAGRLEGPNGDLSQYGLNGALLDLDEAREVLAKTEVTA
jgi:8-hydroxy-5-deazaflavin:NADPH oxidoreductase